MQPEIKEKLDVYHALLLKWQAKINLISPNTIENAWERHFEDSLQLLNRIPEDTAVLADLGSGAGFPGLVIAIIRPDIEVHLIESDSKKCSFLRAVSRETDTPIVIHNGRIENVSRETELRPDTVTARALSSLKELIGYSEMWISANPKMGMVLPKGAKAQAEIDEARTYYDFKISAFTSKTDEDAQILVLNDISPLASRVNKSG